MSSQGKTMKEAHDHLSIGNLPADDQEDGEQGSDMESDDEEQIELAELEGAQKIAETSAEAGSAQVGDVLL